MIIKITLTIIIIVAFSLRRDHDLNYWSQLHRQITAPRSFSVLGTSVPTTNAHNDFFRARQLLWLQSLTKPIQDEKNQLLTTNIWLNLVSISKNQLKYSVGHDIAFADFLLKEFVYLLLQKQTLVSNWFHSKLYFHFFIRSMQWVLVAYWENVVYEIQFIVVYWENAVYQMQYWHFVWK